jgi:hypothetical protein
MTHQNTSNILMIRPVRFAFNEQTAVNNAFQQPGSGAGLQQHALQEFDGLAALLRSHDVQVLVVDDTQEPHTPDSIFPNNWVSFHSNGTVCLYPMFAVNRRHERKPHVIERVRDTFKVRHILDLSVHEKNGLFLEGTGSMVLDRAHRVAYACLSARTDRKMVEEFCRKMSYRAHCFHASDPNGAPIYHTNVMMCVAKTFAVVCMESIINQAEKTALSQSLASLGKEIIEISMEQMGRFAGNMLQVVNERGEPLLIMSDQAFQSLMEDQIQRLEKYNPIIHAPLDTIEQYGGGSARCMLAEIFLPLRG